MFTASLRPYTVSSCTNTRFLFIRARQQSPLHDNPQTTVLLSASPLTRVPLELHLRVSSNSITCNLPSTPQHYKHITIKKPPGDTHHIQHPWRKDMTRYTVLYVSRYSIKLKSLRSSHAPTHAMLPPRRPPKIDEWLTLTRRRPWVPPAPPPRRLSSR